MVGGAGGKDKGLEEKVRDRMGRRRVGEKDEGWKEMVGRWEEGKRG